MGLNEKFFQTAGDPFSGLSEIAKYQFENNWNNDITASLATTGGATFSTDSIVGTYSAEFDGSSYVDWGQDTTSGLNNNNTTFSAWVKLTAYNTASYGTDMVITGQQDWYYYIAIAGSNYTGITTGAVMYSQDQNVPGDEDGGYVTASATGISLDTWTHIAVTQSSTGGAKIYINGAVDGAETARTSNAADRSSSGGESYIGAYKPTTAAATQYFGGLIDQVRVFNSVLDAADILNLYGEGDRYEVDFLVAAGGGGGGAFGGGGAGGLLTTYATSPSTSSGNQTKITLTHSTVYTITVGNAGAGNNVYGNAGSVGSDSSIVGSDITDVIADGGGYGNTSSTFTAGAGGSGGGSGWNFSSAPAGSATTGQGCDGGIGANNDPSPSTFLVGGGGGGASATPATPSLLTVPGAGGEGVDVSITGATVGYAGGGGGNGFYGPSDTVDNGSGAAPTTGGGGAGNNWNGVTTSLSPVYPGTDGKGGGGGGGANGGSGVVILRMPTANYSGTTVGSPTVIPDGTDTILVYNGSGSYTA